MSVDKTADDIVLEVRNVTKIFGDRPDEAVALLERGQSKAEVQAQTGQVVGLKRVSLAVKRGEIFVVMGLSGSGKSTLIRHVNRLIDPTAGELEVNGRDILGLDADQLRTFRRSEVAMVFQNFGLLPHRTVIDNVAYGLEIRGVAEFERRATAQDWINTVGLEGYEESQPHELSGGQRQRVGLARALAMDTDIMLMDEAFSALDPLIRSGMQDQLLELQRKLHKTILFITHDFDEAVKIGDRIAVLNDGEVVQIGRPEEIVLNPANAYVMDFVRDVNRARVISVRSIMGEGAAAPDAPQVNQNATCEDVLPLFADAEIVGVVDGAGKPVGHINASHIIGALAKHSLAQS